MPTTAAIVPIEYPHLPPERHQLRYLAAFGDALLALDLRLLIPSLVGLSLSDIGRFEAAIRSAPCQVRFLEQYPLPDTFIPYPSGEPSPHTISTWFEAHYACYYRVPFLTWALDYSSAPSPDWFHLSSSSRPSRRGLHRSPSPIRNPASESSSSIHSDRVSAFHSSITFASAADNNRSPLCPLRTPHECGLPPVVICPADDHPASSTGSLARSINEQADQERLTAGNLLAEETETNIAPGLDTTAATTTTPALPNLPVADVPGSSGYPRLFSGMAPSQMDIWAAHHTRRARPRHTSSGINPHLDYVPFEKPQKLEVTRGQYQAITDFVGRGKRFGYIVGPTACGKSSYALLDLLEMGKSILLVQPSNTNVASCMANFKDRIPAAIETRNLPYSNPNVAHCGFLSCIDSPAQLNVCESTDLLDFFNQYGTFPPVDIIFFDEFHLPRQEHVICRLLLTHLVYKENPFTVLFASATPPDEAAPPPRMDGLTITKIKLRDPTVEPLDDHYQLSKLPYFGNNMLLVIADSCLAAHHLQEKLSAMGQRAFLLCQHVSSERATELLITEKRNVTFIATPETEAGLDVPCSHFTNGGTALRTLFSRGVLFSSIFKLGSRQNVQRLGRAGRARHSLCWVDDSGQADDRMDACSPVDAATGYLIIFRHTGKQPDSPDCRFAVKEFGRLAKVTSKAAELVLQAPDATPVLELYKRNTEGELFREFGGHEDGFIDECAADLRLFVYPGGAFFAPFVDLKQDYDPTQGQTLKSIRSLAKAAINNLPHLRDKEVNVREALKYAERFPDMFTTPIWLAFKTLKGKSVLKTRSPEEDPIFSDPVALFGELGARAWRILGAKASITISSSSSGDRERPYQIHRTLHYGGEQFEFTSRDILEDRTISEAKVTRLLITHLKPVAQIFMLQTDPEFKSCDLAEFAYAQNRAADLFTHHSSEHKAIDMDTYKGMFTDTARRVTNPSNTVDYVQPKLLISRAGMTVSNFKNIRSTEVTSNSLITFQAAANFLLELGAKFGCLDPSHERLQIDLFILILNHAGTDDVEGLGSTTLMSNDGTAKKTITWVQFQEAAKEYFDGELGIKFTFRRCIPSFERLWWELWNMDDLEALDDVKQFGTRRSRRWQQSGEPVEPYVLVPDLFDDHLTARERKVRLLYNEIVELEKEAGATTDDITYVGRDSEHKIGKAKLRDALEDNARARAMLNGGKARSNASKEHDDWMDTLNKQAIANNARYRD
ncbi:hypothetical protein DL762_004221 [Monosporascus cannonballus]|uniref:DEAD/DEAH-box helicase domain-containing protein n=1 Tax=Monosporascus cannonballus TaxID=155416 RepID=A0ABY0H8G6_9PEZI|nr:hypothetical protein DL762_004221 [Monosporascus cannonballus]